MAEQYVARFRKGTPEQRRALIIKLGNAGDPRAIIILQQIAQGEPDLALQKLALQAAQHLQKLPNPNAGRATPVPNAALPNPVSSTATEYAPRSIMTEPEIVEAEVIEDRYEIRDRPPSAVARSPLIVPDLAETSLSTGAVSAASVVVEPTRPRVVTEQQKRLAKSKLDQVITQQIAGQYKEALVTLAEAASYDPEILNTTIGANLAATLTDLPRDQAIAAVLAISNSPKMKRGQSALPIKFEAGELFDTAVEGAALLVVFIFVLAIVSLGAVRLVNRLFTGFGDVVTQYGTSNPRALATTVAQLTNGQGVSNAQLQGQDPNAVAAFNQLFNNPALATLEAQVHQGQIGATSPEFQATATAALQSAFSQSPIVPPAVQSVAIDAVGGALRLLLTTVLTIMTIYLIGLMFGGSGGILRFVRYMNRAYLVTYSLMLGGLALLFFVLQQPTMPTSTQTLLIVAGFLFIGVGVVVGFGLQCYAAARAHQFGFFKGLGAVMIGGFAFGLISTVLGLGSVLNTAR